MGLIHMVGLDLNNLDKDQLAWLETDLARANLPENRKRAPWIMVMSHFPIFHTKTQKYKNFSVEHYLGDENMENYSPDAEGVDFVPCPDDETTCETIGQWTSGRAKSLQPLFKKYGVDIYNAGHVHSYESTYPICNFTSGSLCDGQQDYNEPKGVIHITDGNGGVPGCRAEVKMSNCTTSSEDFCRVKGSGAGAFGRITAFNSSVMLYEHVQNNGSVVMDSFTIVQHNHGPFSMMD